MCLVNNTNIAWRNAQLNLTMAKFSIAPSLQRPDPQPEPAAGGYGDVGPGQCVTSRSVAGVAVS
jgi:hypothetical protein